MQRLVECGCVSHEHERGWTARLTLDDEVAACVLDATGGSSRIPTTAHRGSIRSPAAVSPGAHDLETLVELEVDLPTVVEGDLDV